MSDGCNGIMAHPGIDRENVLRNEKKKNHDMKTSKHNQT
jgi:hypothetical protein